MCFRGNFSGGASAKDKGHWGHREWFFCSSGFQIIQGWNKGAFCLSFSPCPSLSLAFHSISYWISLSAMLCRLSRDSPDQIKHSHSAPFVPTWDGFIRRSTIPPPPKRQHPHKSHSRQQPSSVSLSLFLSPPSGCADADKTQKSLLKCSCLQRSRNSICWGSWLFWKDRRQHVTASLHRLLWHSLVSLTKVKTRVVAIWNGLSQRDLAPAGCAGCICKVCFLFWAPFT